MCWVMNVILDTNCFINAVRQKCQAYERLKIIFQASEVGKITLLVSLHSLHELERKPDAAFALAQSLPLLPHFPIGAWDEQIGTWTQLSGTWEDAKRNDEIQKDLMTLTKSGADLRDHGAYIDALLAKADLFVTSDKDLAGSGPSKRIAEKYNLRIVKPEILAHKLSSDILV